jgi:shikimate dehydrogenase/3-dehydroquinate dehydratase type I
MTKVAAVIVARDGADAERQARAALARGADLVELRLDHVRGLESDTIRRLACSVGSRAIATLRSPSQGGAPAGHPSRRAALLKEIGSQGFAYLDLELESDREHLESLVEDASRHRTKTIVSHHFAAIVDPACISEAIDACSAHGDIAKVAAPVADFDAASQLVDLARARMGRTPLVLIGMGLAGTVTRALADTAGQEIQYASWGPTTVPGQLTLAAAGRLKGREAIVLGLLGHPLEHSISPAIHEAALAALGLPAVYLPFDVPPVSLDRFIAAADRLRIRGFNVTIPFKEAMAQSVDELDGDAERLGAVNTVILRDGWTRGHNTDVTGFRVSLRSLGLRAGGRNALVVGAGGAAKAVVYVLLREGAHVHVTNRTLARAESLADSFDEPVDVIPTASLPQAGPWDLLVNATPVGTKGFPGGLPVPESVVAKSSFVYDLGYNPMVTPLLQTANRLNRPGTSGLEMLLQQAAKSFELWTGRSAPFDAMRRAAKEALG